MKETLVQFIGWEDPLEKEQRAGARIVDRVPVGDQPVLDVISR